MQDRYLNVLEQYPGIEPLLEVTGRIIDQAHLRVGELSTRNITRDMVAENLEAAVASPNTHVLMVPGKQERMLGMLTLNFGQTLGAEGERNAGAWIDDVVVAEDARGQKISSRLMDAGEAIAEQEASEVRLTSSSGRGPARVGYEKRGYVLQPETLYRKKLSQMAMDETVTPRRLAKRLDEIHDEDVFEIAGLTGLPEEQIRQNAARALKSPETTALFVARDDWLNITDVASANVYPIPVGRKPWIEAVSKDPLSQGALKAAEEWVATKYDSVNIAVLTSPPSGYGKRDSGLYIKQLPQAA